jgi:hypothetical protein
MAEEMTRLGALNPYCEDKAVGLDPWSSGTRPFGLGPFGAQALSKKHLSGHHDELNFLGADHAVGAGIDPVGSVPLGLGLPSRNFLSAK